MNLSRKLGPRARRLAEQHSQEVIESVVEIARSANLDKLAVDVKEVGGQMKRQARNSGYVRVNIIADHLEDLARLREVIYIETNEAYS